MEMVKDRLEFQEFLSQVPKVIHACHIEKFRSVASIALESGPNDEMSNRSGLNLEQLEGSGTVDKPFEYYCAADVSPHCMVCLIWFILRLFSRNLFLSAQWPVPTYLRVNDYLFEVSREGVIAEDGVFTKLI